MFDTSTALLIIGLVMFVIIGNIMLLKHAAKWNVNKHNPFVQPKPEQPPVSENDSVDTEQAGNSTQKPTENNSEPPR